MDALEKLTEIRHRVQEWRDNEVFEGDQNFQSLLEEESRAQEEFDAEVEETWRRLRHRANKINP